MVKNSCKTWVIIRRIVNIISEQYRYDTSNNTTSLRKMTMNMTNQNNHDDASSIIKTVGYTIKPRPPWTGAEPQNHQDRLYTVRHQVGLRQWWWSWPPGYNGGDGWFMANQLMALLLTDDQWTASIFTAKPAKFDGQSPATSGKTDGGLSIWCRMINEN